MLELLQDLMTNPDFSQQVKYEHIYLKKNYKIIEEGKKNNHFYIIISGKVLVNLQGKKHPKTHGEDNEMNPDVHPGLASLGPNDIFGEFAIVDDEPASADVVTAEETELLAINVNAFRSYLKANPEIGYQIISSMLQVLVKRLRHANQTIISLFLWGLKAHNIDKHLA